MQASNTLSGLQGNLTLMLPVVLLSLFVGVIGGIYIAEWLPRTHWIRRVVEGKVAIFAGMPSLLYGLLALEVFVFRDVGFSVQALAFVLLVMPIAIQSTQRAVQRVDLPLREAAYALGTNRWRVLSDHVLRLALPDILAGSCRALSRALAVAGLLIVVYAVPIARMDSVPMSKIGVILACAVGFSVLANILERRSRLQP